MERKLPEIKMWRSTIVAVEAFNCAATLCGQQEIERRRRRHMHAAYSISEQIRCPTELKTYGLEILINPFGSLR